MVCQQCKTEILAGANFCHVCGSMIRPYCVLCRLPMPAQAQFCAQCGQSLQMMRPTQFQSVSHHHQAQHIPASQPVYRGVPSQPTAHLAPPSQPETASQQYAPAAGPEAKQRTDLNHVMPEHLKDKFHQASAAIESERKLVSIVFADISGFTAMSEKMDPEKVTEIMNKCFQELGKIVYEHEGYIDKFMGDCIMALFGAPIAHENDPELAVSCSVRLLERLKTLNDEIGTDLGMSIGINSGMVIAGGVGTDAKFEYTVMGDAVNLAQRLQSAAQRGQILVSKNIYRSCEKKFDFEVLEPIKVKGKQDKVEIFAALGKKKKELRNKSLHVGFGKLIGREKELDIFKKCLDDSQNGSGQIFCILGEAGIGKSRFKHEIKKMIYKQKTAWFEATCNTLHKEVPYSAFIQLLSDMLGIEETIEGGIKEKKSHFESFNLDENSEALIRSLLNISVAGVSEPQLDPAKKKRALFVAIKTILIETARKSPVVFYLEDLHWMDPLSLELFAFIMESIPSYPIMLAGSFRKEFKHQWHDKPHFNQITLEPLTNEKCVLMVKSLLNLEDVPGELEDLIIKRCDGNPLYVEEIIKNMIDEGKIYKSGDHWAIIKDIKSMQIPPTLQGLIASRIDKLYEADKLLIQYASVIGRKFSDALLAKSVDMVDRIYDSLQFLRKKELIFEISSDAGEITYIFNHALTQEVAYNSILTKKRKEFHLRVAQAIEALYLDQIEDHVETLAHHYVEAEVEEKAVDYLFKSGDKLISSYSNDGAIKNYQTAIKLMEDSTASEKYNKKLWVAYDQIAVVYARVGKYDKAAEYHNKILNMGQERQDHLMLTNCYRQMGDVARVKGHVEEATNLLNLSLEHAHHANHFESEIKTYKALGNTMTLKHDIPKAIEYLAKGLEGAQSLGLTRIEAEFLNDIALTYIAQGDLDAAQQRLEESINISKADFKHKSLLVSSTLNLGVVQYHKKDFEGAMAKFRETFAVAKQIGDLGNSLLSSHNIGEILMEFDRFDEALVEFETCYKIANDIGNIDEALNNKILMGCVKGKMGKKDDGEMILTESIKEAAQRKLWPRYSEAAYSLGKLYLDVHNIAASRKWMGNALSKAEEIKYHDIISKAGMELKTLEVLSNSSSQEISEELH
ncbi:MAG: tetratricopeptide repeat protein [Deltaproteobacteria bacterium]|nr:tetratricopeptide repeat protein [Deltaproteobacteria bacterium]